MIARLKANMASTSDAHTSWTVAKEGGNGYIFTATIINFDALGGLIMNEDQFQWDKENGVEYAANGVVRRTSCTITVSSGIRDEVLVLLIISNNRIRGNQWDVKFV